MLSLKKTTAIIDSCIIVMYSADNNSRLFALTSNPEYYDQYDKDVQLVGNLLNRLERNTHSHDTNLPAKVNDLLEAKSEKLDDYIRLKHLSDSLLLNSKELITINTTPLGTKRKSLVPVSSAEILTDTLRTIAETGAKKRSFFGRIFGAFSSKKEDSDPAHTSQQSSAAVVANTTITPVGQNLKATRQVVPLRNYDRLHRVNNQLKASEREILLISNNLIDQIIQSLEKYKAQEQEHMNMDHALLDSDLQEADSRYRKLSGMIIFVLVALVSLVLYNIWKIYKYQKNLIYHSVHAEKSAATKAAFLAGMSHEIRTPLNSIIGFSEQLSMSELNAIQKEQLNAVSRSSKTLLDIVNQVLDFSKIETGKMTFEHDAFKLREILEEVFNTMSIQAKNKGIAISKSFDFPAELSLKGDALRLKQVLINLLGNAIKFTKEGGVSLKASVGADKKNFVRLVVKVQDTGVGISKDDVHLIFGEFSQVASAQKEASHKGTGLGLAISKKIIEQQGGYIRVSSEEGKGSVFKFSLPLEVNFDKEIVTPANKVGNSLNLSRLQGKRMLIAEDNPLNILLLKTILKKWNIDFDMAVDGVEAFDLYQDTNYDLIITDIEMPRMGGLELADRIRSVEDEAGAMPIIALTANVFKEDHERYIAAGLDGVILKPFSEQSLFTGIISILERPESPEIDTKADEPISMYNKRPMAPTTWML